MTDDVDSFVENAQGVRSATGHHEGTHIHVYKGKLAERDEAVRILTLAPSINDQAAVESFMRAAGEWQNASTHPNIVTVYERAETPRPWIAIADVDGQTLDAARPNLEPTERASLVADTAEAVRNGALYNIVHGALSPEHIFVVPEDGDISAVVDDWGLRQAVRTAVGAFDVTPYTSPEQLNDPASGNARTDVYGLGAVAYYVLTGNQPVKGADLSAAIHEGDITPPSEFDTTLSEAVDKALMQALATNPEDRQESAYAFKRAFVASYSPDPADDGDNGAAGAAAVDEADESDSATDVTVDEESPQSTRRMALGVLGLGLAGLGSGWLARQMRNEGDGLPETTAPDSTQEPTEESTTSEISYAAQNGLAYHDGHVYIISDSEILKVDRATDDVTNRFSAPSDSRPTGLAYGNESLWFADAVGPDYDGEVAELNPETGEVKSSIPSSWDPRGLAFGEESLWVVDITTNSIVEFSPDGDRRSSFDTPGVTWGQGLAYFDGSLWLGNNCSGDNCTVALREYDTDGNQIQRTEERSSDSTAPYAGLAATETELLGPGRDGQVTVLRTL